MPFKELSIGSFGLCLRQPNLGALELVVMLAIVELVF